MGEDNPVSAFIQSIQGDLNCLSDPDRCTRKSALDRLHRCLASGGVGFSLSPVDIIQVAWDTAILQVVLKVLNDNVEKCRELAVLLISSVVKQISQVEHTAKLVVPAIAERIGHLPVQEDSEEIRLLSLNVLNNVLVRCSAVTLKSILDPLCQMLCVSLADPFQEVKKAASRVIVSVVQQTDVILVGKSESLLNALIPNLKHAHSQVRLSILQAVNAVMRCDVPACLVSECLAPCSKVLAFDKSAGVRKLFFESVAQWLGYTKDIEGPFQPSIQKGWDPRDRIPHLLPLLLLGVSDESCTVATATLPLLDGVGEVYEVFMKLVIDKDFFGQLVHTSLKDLKEWSISTRLGAARLLHTLLFLAERHAIKNLDILILAFCSAVVDDDLSIARCVVKAIHVLAYYICPDDWLPLVLEYAMNSSSSLSQIANGLVVLSGLLYGTPLQVMNRQTVIKISRHLFQMNLGFSDQPVIRRQLLAVLTNLVQVGGSLCEPASLDMMILFLQLKCSESGLEQRENAICHLETLAKAIGLTSSNDLFQNHLDSLIAIITPGYEAWSEKSPEQYLFQIFMRNAATVIGPCLQMLLQVFIECVHHNRDPSLRISFLKLLDELFETPELETWWLPLAPEVISTILIPCAVWQVGKVGAAIRHATMVGLATFLRKNLCTQVQLISLIQSHQLLAVVASCLEEDYYVDTRHITCHVMESMLQLIGAVMDDDQRNEVSKVLQKRLDDSSDMVRLGILRAISVFIHTMPDSHSDSSVKSFIRNILLHIGDSNVQIQDAVYNVAKICAMKQPVVVEEAVKSVCDYHQMAEYCDSLLSHAMHWRNIKSHLTESNGLQNV